MNIHQPTGKMKIVTKCERVQPTCVGVDKNGELKWEGKEMARWQMEMFRQFLDWAGSRFARWSEVVRFEDHKAEFKASDSLLPDEDKAHTKEAIQARKMMYSKGKYWNRIQGD